jgi:hypothetical protein
MTYKIQIDDEVREANKDEIAFIEAEIVWRTEKETDVAERTAAKQTVLNKLGLTSDEAKLLLS